MRADLSPLICVGLSGILAWNAGCAEKTTARAVREDVPTVAAASAASPSLPSGLTEEQQEGVTQARMRALGRSVAAGDLKALDELQSIHETLYGGIDYDRERSRVMTNLRLMRAAFDVIGEAAGKGSKEAMQALRQANDRPGLRSWTPDAFGIAAGMGNGEALDILINYRKYGMLLSSVVFALKPAAGRNDSRAVDFLIQVLDDPNARPLRHGASEGLESAEAAGSERAAAALKRYRERH